MTKQESQVQVSTVEAGTVTARPGFSKPLFPKALSHLRSPGRAGLRTVLSWSRSQQFQVFGSGQAENSFALQPPFFLPLLEHLMAGVDKKPLSPRDLGLCHLPREMEQLLMAALVATAWQTQREVDLSVLQRCGTTASGMHLVPELPALPAQDITGSCRSCSGGFSGDLSKLVFNSGPWGWSLSGIRRGHVPAAV